MVELAPKTWLEASSICAAPPKDGITWEPALSASSWRKFADLGLDWDFFFSFFSFLSFYLFSRLADFDRLLYDFWCLDDFLYSHSWSSYFLESPGDFDASCRFYNSFELWFVSGWESLPVMTVLALWVSYAAPCDSLPRRRSISSSVSFGTESFFLISLLIIVL